MITANTPAMGLAAILETLDVVGDGTGWTICTEDIESDKVCLFVDYASSLQDGRDMRTGLVFGRPLVQVTTLVNGYLSSYEKITEIVKTSTENINRQNDHQFTIGDYTYRLNSVSLISGPFNLGVSEIKRRNRFSVNFSLSVTQIN